MTDVYEFSATTIAGEERKLADYRGKVLLIVNVASKCGFTPQYTGLRRLYRRTIATAGLVVLGFPCDQFGHQEPGDEAEIDEFCSLTYDVDVPDVREVDVNGADAHPLYQWLKSRAAAACSAARSSGTSPSSCVGRDGQVIDRYAPTDTPDKLEPKVLTALG